MHPEFEKKEAYREMAVDAWDVPKLLPKRDSIVPAVAGTFMEPKEDADGKLDGIDVSQVASVALSVTCITDKPTALVVAITLQFIRVSDVQTTALAALPDRTTRMTALKRPNPLPYTINMDDPVVGSGKTVDLTDDT